MQLVRNAWRKQRLSKKKLKRLRKEKRARAVIKMAESLNKDLPASEVWFHKKFQQEEIRRLYGTYKKGSFLDIKNEPFFNYYIPDVVNHGYRFIIEIDGEIHNNLKQAYKDLAKDQYYRKRHYKVFRVKAFDDDSYNKFILEFKEYIIDCHNRHLKPLIDKVELSPDKVLCKGDQRLEIVLKKPEEIILQKSDKPKTILRKASP